MLKFSHVLSKSFSCRQKEKVLKEYIRYFDTWGLWHTKKMCGLFSFGGGQVYSWQYLPTWELCVVYNPTSFLRS